MSSISNIEQSISSYTYTIPLHKILTSPAYYYKPFFPNKLTPLPYPNNLYIRQRIRECEWTEFTHTFHTDLYQSISSRIPVYSLCILFIAASLIYSWILALSLLCLSCMGYIWHGSLSRRRSMNALYRILAKYNKYLFKPRGLQLRLQLDCRKQHHTHPLHGAHFSLKIDIAHLPTRESLLAQYTTPRSLHRSTLIVRAAKAPCDYYERNAGCECGVACLPPVDPLLDDSQVTDVKLNYKYGDSMRAAYTPVAVASAVAESPALDGSVARPAYPYSTVTACSVDYDRYSAITSNVLASGEEPVTVARGYAGSRRVLPTQENSGAPDNSGTGIADIENRTTGDLPCSSTALSLVPRIQNNDGANHVEQDSSSSGNNLERSAPPEPLSARTRVIVVAPYEGVETA